jgi:endonuclease III
MPGSWTWHHTLKFTGCLGAHRFDVNPLLVGFGQQTCKAIAPRCDACEITALCPVFNKQIRI